MIRAINASKTVAGRRNSSRMFSAASYSSSVMDPYKTLRIQPGATESEVRKAFWKLALQYHPDVCKGINCGG
ncbi:Chaperone protein dnaJ 8, chloroplastic [Linum perenne]